MDDEERAEQREQAKNRLEMFEALSLAASRRTEVLEAVGQAADAAAAESALRQLLGIGRVPAQAIMDMQVRRFTERERDRLALMCDEVRLEVEKLR
jgi:DNA gyrase/topoisomerase IV subunit A